MFITPLPLEFVDGVITAVVNSCLSN
jgi:hypothetical protein